MQRNYGLAHRHTRLPIGATDSPVYAGPSRYREGDPPMSRVAPAAAMSRMVKRCRRGAESSQGSESSISVRTGASPHDPGGVRRRRHSAGVARLLELCSQHCLDATQPAQGVLSLRRRRALARVARPNGRYFWAGNSARMAPAKYWRDRPQTIASAAGVAGFRTRRLRR